MNEDQMKIDPVILERIVILIEKYTVEQKAILSKLTSDMKNLSQNRDDKKTFGEMFEYLKSTNSKSIEMLESIRVNYKKFYESEILNIKKTLASLKV